MFKLNKLHETSSLNELANLLGYKPKALSFILYKIPNEKKYTEFPILKKHNGIRKIKAPTDLLKSLQKRLSDLLNDCYDEISKKNKQNKSLSHGFRREHSIVTNAMQHKNKRYVFNVDLQDFFPSINFGRVRGFFIKNKHFNLDQKVATIIAQIACHDNELPQGSPCSPVISNLIGHLLDIRMANLAKKTKCTYSRYVDDLTFSTNKKKISEKIAIKKNETDWEVGIKLKNEIEKVGFIVNESKTSMQYKTARQITTGLIVNKKINIKKEYYKKARSMCHSLFKSDEFFIETKQMSTKKSLKQSEPKNRIKGSVKKLEGILSFIYQIKRPYDINKDGERRFNPNAITKLYRQLLFYKYFFSINIPLTICEGKTDIIYLKCALRQLANYYKELVQKNDDGIDYRVGFLNMSRNLKDVFAISNGTPGLASLMDIYKKNMVVFKGQGKKSPVILLVDDDSGAKEIKKKLNISVFEKPYYKYVENLYVVPILSTNGRKETEIEDLFENEILNTKIQGKKFSRKPKIDIKTEYGKMVFAEKVIKAKQSEINFDNFKSIFNSFIRVINDYKN